MKILKLKFKNINSLSGENEIDFTKPEFSNNGIFAITGNTGSGKTTILDAIALALYGRTPRMSVTNNTNDIMTRGEKDCFAEIIFEANGKVWKSTLKQGRAKTGTLKSLERTLADEDNKIIEDKNESVNKKVAEILGLSFDQFTKVVLLAQGNFTAFLEADKNNKGLLLEQITGTAIYADISKRVFDRNKAEKLKLENLELQLSAIKILNDEQISALNNGLTILEQDKKLLKEELDSLEKAFNWLSELEKIEKQIAENKLQLPNLTEKLKLSKDKLENIESNLLSLKDQQTKLQPIANAVRAIDTQITEKNNQLSPIVDFISVEKNKLSELQNSIQIQKTSLEEQKSKLLEKEAWSKENSKKGELVSNFVALENEHNRLGTKQYDLKTNHSEIAAIEQSLTQKAETLLKAEASVKDKDDLIKDKNTGLDKLKIEIEELLAGKSLAELNTDLEKITEFGKGIGMLLESEKAIALHQNEIAQLTNQNIQLESERNALLIKIENEQQNYKQLKDKIELLEENIKLTKAIHSFEDLRKDLCDGEPCPLCGSLEHPFAEGNIPEIGTKEQEVLNLKNQSSLLLEHILQYKNKESKLKSDQENCLANKIKAENALGEHLLKRTSTISYLNTNFPNYVIQENDIIGQLTATIEQKRVELLGIRNTINATNEKNTELNQIRDEITGLTTEKLEKEQVRKDAFEAKLSVEQSLLNKKEIFEKAQIKYNSENDDFKKRLEHFEADHIETLRKSLQDWNDNKDTIEKLKAEIQSGENKLELDHQNFNSKENLLKTKQHEATQLKSEKDSLWQKRLLLFGDKSVEEAEKTLYDSIAVTEIEKKNASTAYTDTLTAFESNKAILIQKEQELNEKAKLGVTEKTIEETAAALEDKKQIFENLIQKIGADTQILETNAERLKDCEGLLKQKAKQYAISNRWKTLDDLIGSSEGNTYRNFAQSLTFEHLISLSNQQLQKMSDRYLLKRSDEKLNPFELTVIDKYQNGEERTAKNLSGGEKFIISLALALGLANMAGKNMRIDTMFIDEGFGTLDTQYLEVAVNALRNLQSEGKIIGVISHMAELKEQIPTHIELIPGGIGHSKIRVRS
jgi:exonuclease SbcC